MNICILSMQKINNFGSLLQSYSLMKLLQEKHHSTSFIDIKKKKNIKVAVDKIIENYTDEAETKTKSFFFNKLSRVDRYLLNRIRIKKLSNIQNNVFEEFRRNNLQITDSDNNKHYDLCVIGSDEVFNCASRVNYSFTSQLFGNVEQADNVITYAASCGATEYEDITQPMAAVIRKSFKNISAFSVRDKNTESFVKELSNKDVHIHLDPVLVGDFEEEIKQVELPPKLPQKYCIVYSYYNRIHKKEEIEAIKNFCKEKGLEIVAIGAPQKWIKKYIVMDPFQVLAAFQNAEFVITDTFHGTIFSAKYNGKFAVITRGSNENKLGDLIDRLKINDHRISSFDELQKAWEAPDTVKQVNELCKREREKTLNYFEDYFKAISGSENKID